MGEIIQGHVLEVLKALSDDSIHCCITSPPYWGLRDYDLEPVVWGGEPGCEHAWGDMLPKTNNRNTRPSGDHPRDCQCSSCNAEYRAKDSGQFCQRCHAWRGSLGLEPDLHMYVAHLVEIFREVRRVLHPSGVCFVNMGDSYARQAGDDRKKTTDTGMKTGRSGKNKLLYAGGNNTPPDGLKPKDLCGIPWRLALALQDDGWWLRNDIIWSKNNPMPESVKDRFTVAHEYVFMLTKRGRYFFDQEAVREKNSQTSDRWGVYPGSSTAKAQEIIGGKHGKTSGIVSKMTKEEYREKYSQNGRNPRTVWSIATQPFSGAHFATFPTALVKKCILAGSSPYGVCPECLSPWERVVEREREFTRPIDDDPKYMFGFNDEHRTKKGLVGRPMITSSSTTGWRPTCACHGKFLPIPCLECNGSGLNDFDYPCGNCGGKGTVKQYVPAEGSIDDIPTVPATVLDPFLGSGTTAIVAKKMGRDWVGIELNPEYVEMAWTRINQAQPALFAEGLEMSR